MLRCPLCSQGMGSGCFSIPFSTRILSPGSSRVPFSTQIPSPGSSGVPFSSWGTGSGCSGVPFSMQLSLVRPSPGGDGVPKPAVPWPSGGSPLPPAHTDFYPRFPHQGCEPPGPVHEGKWGPGRAGHSARAGFGDTRWGRNAVPPLRQLMGAADFHIVALDYRGTATPCPLLSLPWGPGDRPLGAVTPQTCPPQVMGTQAGTPRRAASPPMSWRSTTGSRHGVGTAASSSGDTPWGPGRRGAR